LSEKVYLNCGKGLKYRIGYYPFGEQLPGRNSMNDYRYAFQGQELDRETGMEAFQLRLWDGRIGRWLNPDPYGEFDSPYLGMGNDPINLTDPDGGSTQNCCPDKPKDGGTLDEVVIESTRTRRTNDFRKDFSFRYTANFGVASGWDAGWNRVTGGAQMIGGGIETVFGGVGGVLTSETGVGAFIGGAIFLNGLDNTATGAQQLWTGQAQNTYLHKGVYATVKYAGADDYNAEEIASGADIVTLVLGGASSLKASKNLKPMVDFKNVKHGKWQIGLNAKNTNKHLRFERHRLQTADPTKVYKSTHINYGIHGKKHIFIRNAKRYRPYVKE
jgi:RHS repeat-associated protein